ncbi:hypothetical protein N7457_007464 [Penicillium paradoxum]|uniref:uncharacterized protein n=1 Tax=Penicillium paradoxum TaxID=176176 RepID=UPI0025479470|nr:uncharacterized protein N7457_007464 [Penicillium paradoxum]KAJ5779744.1 hypothetical protein N7457_007464 [Penicillium paradoxum]
MRAWFGYPQACPYIGTRGRSVLKTGYIIISFVTKGQMLSNTLADHLLGDRIRRRTLFGDLAKIMLSLNRVKLPQIGSLSLDDKGIVQLKNRPLTLRLQTFENEGIPTIPRNCTYQCVEPYILDLLQLHDNRIHHQPNAIHNLNDGQEQFAALTMMRGLLPQFISRQYRNGPFGLTLTDLHPSKIFVDENWHITSLIDLEWACSYPIELQTPPYWLTGRPIDDIEHGEHLQTFENAMTEFLDAFKEQEKDFQAPGASQAEIMEKCWVKGSFWYFQAVQSPKGLLRVFNEHVQRMFCEEHCTQRLFDQTVSPYWAVGAESFIQTKVEEEAEYKNRLRKRFEEVG